MGALPRRTLVDWHPDLGATYDAWLDALAHEGWTPEHNVDGAEIQIRGRLVRRVALIELDAHMRWIEPGGDDDLPANAKPPQPHPWQP